MSTAKIIRWDLEFKNALTTATGTFIKRVKRSSTTVAVHNIRGYYYDPWNPENIKVQFTCRHPTQSVVKYCDREGVIGPQWTGEMLIDGMIRKIDPVEENRHIVMTVPSRQRGGTIDCYFEATQRYNHKNQVWEIIDPGNDKDNCLLKYKIMR